MDGLVQRFGRLRKIQYESYLDFQRQRLREFPLDLPCALSNWDHTPRYGRRARVLLGATPEKFGAQLRILASALEHQPPERRVLFIKSWNEWGEGNCIEPSQKFGDAFLREIHALTAPRS
jgi:hypothetical protein